MAKQVQYHGGSSANHAIFTGASREITVDTTKKTLVVHDGITEGGTYLAKEEDVQNLVTLVLALQARIDQLESLQAIDDLEDTELENRITALESATGGTAGAVLLLE